MYPLNDKDLDRISRDAAEHYSVEPGASGWEQLEQRLNKELPEEKKKDRRRFFFWLFLMTVVSGSGLVWMLSGNHPDTPGLQAQQHVVAPSVAPENSNAATNNPAQPVQNNSNPATDDRSKASGTVSAMPADDNRQQTTGHAPTGDQPATAKTPAAPDQTATGKKQPATHQQQDAEVPGTAINNITAAKQQPAAKTPVATARQQQNKPIKDQPQSGNNKITVNKKTNKESSATDNDKTKPVAPAKDLPDALASKNTADKKDTDNPDAQATAPATGVDNIPDTATRNITAVTNADSTATIDTTALAGSSKPAKQKKKVERPLELGIITGPDFTNVKFKENYKTGFNIGLQIGYRISDRWSFNTGFIYTYRSYMAMGEDFTPPKHTPMSYLDLDTVMSRTSVFEIPLNVRYDFSVRRQHRLYASTGLSTYLFGAEDFDCYYKYNGVDTMRNWKYNENWVHPFSVLNFSVGYEHALGKGFSLQAEPYLKLPLKGLGYGSAMMDSYGLYLTFKYKPRLR